MKFRSLTANEIDCRVATVNKNGCSLLLYKDARCDMNILDETVGPLNWQRSHTRDNANCTVSIWDETKEQWISKEDTGTESYTEKEKGLASDSFKRACFNWGIGRELYTAPFIWVTEVRTEPSGQKHTTKDKFAVKDIVVKDGIITSLSVTNTSLNKVVFSYKDGRAVQKGTAPDGNKVTTGMIDVLKAEMDRKGIGFDKVAEMYHVNTYGELTAKQVEVLMKKLAKTPAKGA